MNQSKSAGSVSSDRPKIVIKGLDFMNNFPPLNKRSILASSLGICPNRLSSSTILSWVQGGRSFWVCDGKEHSCCTTLDQSIDDIKTLICQSEGLWYDAGNRHRVREGCLV